MAFDKPTRNRLAKLVSDARRLIVEEFTEQFTSLYGISENGDVTPLDQLRHLDDTGRATACMLRERIDYLIKTHPDDKDGAAAGVARLAREQAFTVLNRLAAIRMAEKRGIIVESVGKGYQSKGFKVFEQVAGSGLGDTYHRYRRYLFCLFDELAVDLGLLFDRRLPQGLLFPREPALQALLALLNASDLEALWAEDETIGWIYQYYNDPAERKKMREESTAPRNSRELAVRNQFFTPRYVVEFLTDNTLGRIWYEMRQGQTRLKDQCRYLVRRPTEIFLKPCEIAPEIPHQDGLTQEELLKQPVHIAHRPIKDPREIRMLDPACGSMHFGLYAFDLFEVIYEEAWDLGMESLRRDFPHKDALLREVPRLIIEHNIHGIDIDPRAVQIAGLSLWLRAQKSWQVQRVPAAQRPRILRSNIVCAEPMPGSTELLREFTATLNPPLLGQFVEKVFASMQLAGEAGSLLKIEEEIATLVKDAKKLWQSRPQAEQLKMGFALKTEPKQGNLPLDISGISDDRFWETAEERIYAALRSYAEQAESGSYQRRLFAEDAARGFAFIDICRKRYDVILMNPPFGSPAEAFEQAKDLYPSSGRDIYGMCVERMESLRIPTGLVGAILPRTGLFIGTMGDLRREYYLKRIPLSLLLDLGKDVLDGATIRTACYILGSAASHLAICLRIGNIQEREEKINAVLQTFHQSHTDKDIFISDRRYFASLPASAVAYWIPELLAAKLAVMSKMETVTDIRQGIATGDNFRFLRLFTEIPAGHSGFSYYSKGGEPVPFASDESLYVRSADGCIEMKANAAQEYGSASRTIKNEDTFGLPGITYSQVNDACLKFRIHPPDALYDMKGPVLFDRPGIGRMALLAFLNSSAVEDFMRMMTDGRQWHVSALKAIPIPKFAGSSVTKFAQLSSAATRVCQAESSRDESGHYFNFGIGFQRSSKGLGSLAEIEEQIDDSVWAAYGASRDEILSIQRQRHLFLERSFSKSTQPESAHDLIPSLALGAAFGRWDIRIATGEKPAPELPDPFEPLPVCPPGQLQNEQGLPVTNEEVGRLKDEGRWNYPIEVSWEGILVDDPGHPLDIEARVHEVLQVIWKDRSEAIDREACEILGVRSLRDYFRRPAGFFADHLKRYSKSRREAPIYWPLSTAKGNYTLWIYYHRLTDQTLHTALADFVDPKLKSVRAEISSLRESAIHRDRLEVLQDLEIELEDFRAEIERIIKLPWKPNLNDGVLITASPLWKLFRLPKWQKDLKACWEKLEKGEYDWAHLAYNIWPNRVEEVCKRDRSIAIAHNLEHLCEIEPPKAKAKRGKKQPK